LGLRNFNGTRCRNRTIWARSVGDVLGDLKHVANLDLEVPLVLRSARPRRGAGNTCLGGAVRRAVEDVGERINTRMAMKRSLASRAPSDDEDSLRLRISPPYLVGEPAHVCAYRDRLQLAQVIISAKAWYMVAESKAGHLGVRVRTGCGRKRRIIFPSMAIHGQRPTLPPFLLLLMIISTAAASQLFGSSCNVLAYNLTGALGNHNIRYARKPRSRLATPALSLLATHRAARFSLINWVSIVSLPRVPRLRSAVLAPRRRLRVHVAARGRLVSHSAVRTRAHCSSQSAQHTPLPSMQHLALALALALAIR
jgi:hypothetical protein